MTPPRDSMPLRRGVLILTLVGIVGLALDLASKHVAFARLPAAPQPKSSADHFIPHVLDFVLVRNHGAALGFGQGWRWLFVAFSVVAIGVLVTTFLKSSRRWWSHALIGLLLAGVVGNAYDRIRYGYVRDMIHLFPDVPNPLGRWVSGWQTLWPWVFNLADVYLCVGVGVLAVWSLFQKPSPEPTTNA